MSDEGCRVIATGVIACSPSSFPIRRVRYCPTCRCNRRFAGLVYVWYDTDWTCCHCGDSWTAGERRERPFVRAWRARAVATAQEIAARAARFTDADRQQWLEDSLGSVTP